MSEPYLESLVTKRQTAWHRAKELMDSAVAEGRDLSAEENTEIDRIDGAMEGYKAEESRILKLKAAFESADNFRAEMEPRVEKAVITKAPTDRELLRALFNGERRAFDAYPASAEQRALQGGEGGSAVPTSFYDLVTVYERTLDPTFALATVIQSANGAPITLPRLTADPATSGTITAEAGGINELDATISSVQLNPYKYAVTSVWSAELGQDNAINLEDLIARSIGRELGLDIGAELTVGDGSGNPNGFITAGTNGGTAQGTALGAANWTFFGPPDLIDLFYGLPAPYRPFAAWQVSNGALSKMRKFRDSNQQFIWEPSQVIGQADNYLGRPVYENPAMAAVASASKSVAVGDFSRYFVQDVVPMRVALSSDYKFSTDQIALKVVRRVDGDLIDVPAIRFLVSAAT